MQLLKHYLTFISHEINDIQLDQNAIHFNISTPSEPTQGSARLGATLVESMVHDTNSAMEKQLEHKQEGWAFM